VNLQSLAPMAENTLLADTIASIAMLDPILGGIDR
jgi:NADH:ubiquinone oxidoreductase subunit D